MRTCRLLRRDRIIALNKKHQYVAWTKCIDRQEGKERARQIILKSHKHTRDSPRSNRIAKMQPQRPPKQFLTVIDGKLMIGNGRQRHTANDLLDEQGVLEKRSGRDNAP